MTVRNEWFRLYPSTNRTYGDIDQHQRVFLSQRRGYLYKTHHVPILAYTKNHSINFTIWDYFLKNKYKNKYRGYVRSKFSFVYDTLAILVEGFNLIDIHLRKCFDYVCWWIFFSNWTLFRIVLLMLSPISMPMNIDITNKKGYILTVKPYKLLIFFGQTRSFLLTRSLKQPVSIIHSVVRF